MHGSKHRQPHNALSFEVTKNLVLLYFHVQKKMYCCCQANVWQGFIQGEGGDTGGLQNPLKPSKEHVAKRTRARAWARAWDRARVARTVTEAVSLGEISLWE